MGGLRHSTGELRVDELRFSGEIRNRNWQNPQMYHKAYARASGGVRIRKEMRHGCPAASALPAVRLHTCHGDVLMSTRKVVPGVADVFFYFFGQVSCTAVEEPLRQGVA